MQLERGSANEGERIAVDSKPRKVLVVGLDGGTWSVIRPMVEEGRLPTIARLMSEGSWGPLRSTIPACTGPAWSSFMTGKNPGKHGVYHFYLPTKTSYLRRRLVNSTTIRSELLWRVLNRGGIRVGLLDVPLTYPPTPLDGFNVAGGLLAPSENANFTYPPGLHTELLRELGDFPLYARVLKRFRRNDDLGALEELYGLTRNRRKAAVYLLKSHPTELFMVVFRGSDLLQHYAWRYWDEGYQRRHPVESRKLKDVIPQFYEEMDATIAELISCCDVEPTVLVISDHGAGPILKYFHVNVWLRKRGYLFLKRFPRSWPYRVTMARRRLPRLLGGRRVVWPRLVAKHRAERVDWRRTLAYGNFTGDEPAITLNVKGRETWGIVEPGKEYEELRDRIIHELEELRDPDSGLPVVEKAYRREEVYSGPYLEEAPDIPFMPRGMLYRPRGELEAPDVLEAPESLTPATHRMDGILIAWGKEIRRQEELKGARIVDLAPTILHLFELPVPEDMDGRVLTELMSPEYVESHPVRSERMAPERVAEGVGGEVFTEEERRQVEEGLRALGYID